MVDGETSVMMMMMKISSKSLSWQGARTEFLVLNFRWWWHSRTLSGKNAEPPIVSGLEVYIGERRARGGGWGGLTTPWHGQA
jgi:hypothetical protein